jgi:hypothetical protein
MIIKLEALADALAFYSRSFDPESPAYRYRNPGLLPAILLKHPRSADGKRFFISYLDGYQALLFDLKVKCSGLSKTNLTQQSTLLDLMASFGHNKAATKYVAKFLTKALGEEIPLDVQLSYFLGV